MGDIDGKICTIVQVLVAIVENNDNVSKTLGEDQNFSATERDGDDVHNHKKWSRYYCHSINTGTH